jgi:nucleotide-binding universal stress UspA family protein
MFKKLLVPLDGTPQSATALIPARTLARALEASMVLLRVVAADAPDAEARVAQVGLDRVAEELREAGVAVETQVRRGEPAETIIHAVRQDKSDLVLMATHGRSGLDRLFLGSVAVRILAHSQVPVLLLRPGGQRLTTLQRVLVPLDGTPAGAIALATAVGLARATGSRLTLLEVVSPIPVAAYASYALTPGAYIDPQWDEDARVGAQTYVDAVAARLERTGLEAHACARTGHVAGTITSVARDIGADLVIMSTAARTGPPRALLGSVADEVVRMADRPVLLIRQQPPEDITDDRLATTSQEAVPGD